MFNVRRAGGHLYGKQLFTWLSLVVSFMASFVLSFCPLDVLYGIWDLMESVSEDFLPTLYTRGRPGDLHNAHNTYRSHQSAWWFRKKWMSEYQHSLLGVGVAPTEIE